ncbi:helix-turn-helix domain-containing protein [Parasphingorhabdus pacifica]
MGSSIPLGGSIRKLRLRKGPAQQEFAELAGLSVSGLRDLEQGRSDSLARTRSAGWELDGPDQRYRGR